jgi:hypothetical protein
MHLSKSNILSTFTCLLYQQKDSPALLNMKFTSAAAGAVLAGLAVAAPLEERQSTNIDTTILQFALTLEHLENV